LRPRVPELFRLAKQAGLTTSLDTNDDPDGRWENDVFDAIQFVDVLLPNEKEACRLAGGEDSIAAAEKLSEKVPLMVINRGANGILAHKSKESLESMILNIEAIETIG